MNPPSWRSRPLNDFATVGAHVEPYDIARRLLRNGTTVHVRNVSVLGRRAWRITASYDYTGEIDPGMTPNIFGSTYDVDQQTGAVLSSSNWTVTKLVVDKPLPALHVSISAGSQVGVRLTYGNDLGTRFMVIKKLASTMPLDEFIARYASHLPPNWTTTTQARKG